MTTASERPADAPRDDDVACDVVERIRAGDVEAFEALFRRFFERLHFYVLQKVDRPSVADELVQNVFMNLWRRRAKWRPRRSVKAYLYGAARNEAIKHLRHRGVVRRWEERERGRDAPARPSPLDRLHEEELELAIREWVDEMPERRREVFVLSRYHGLSNKEVAATLGIAVSTVEVQMWKALKFLRARLEAFSSVAA